VSYRFSTETIIPRDLSDVFDFFSDVRNLESITPPWLKFGIVTPEPIEMREGALIDYRLRIRGIPVRWRTRSDASNPPAYFIDSQVRGPYRTWIHEHTFEQTSQGVRVLDRLRYEFFCGALLDRWLVRPDIERIFEYRRRRMRELLVGS